MELENKNLEEKIKNQKIELKKNKLASPLTKKFIFLFILVLLLQIPLLFVNSLISDRKYLHEETITSIGNEWGEAQKIIAPVLIRDYVETKTTSTYDTKAEKKEVINNFNRKFAILPAELNAVITIKDEIRERGIYSATVYNANIKLSGYFSKKDFPSELLEGQTSISIGLTDTKALMKINKFKIGTIDKELEAMSGTKADNLYLDGISALLPEEYNTIFENEKIPFEIDIDFRGSKSVSILPLGKKNHFTITSNWTSPSFVGILPTDRNINENGFTANWDISNLVRNYPQLIDLTKDLNYSDFYTKNSDDSYYEKEDGEAIAKVNLFDSVTNYTQINRACKYGILFIMMTLVIVYIFEIASKKVAHYIQYAVVGASLVIFYLLLLSFSEHISFEWAYLISSLAIVIPNSLYITSLTANKKFGVGMFLFLSGVYAILFSILRMEQYALLTGTLLILAILYVIMYITKKVEIFQAIDEQ